MPLSLLVQLVNDPSAGECAKDELGAHIQKADALTLRRLALLSTVERWQNTKIQVELLEEVMRRDDPIQLGIFLASSHLTKHLSQVGALGYALCEAAEKGLIHATSILACRTSEVERARAAIRAAGAGKHETFDCVLRSCKTAEEEIRTLRSGIVAAAGDGHLLLIKQLVAALECHNQATAPLVAVISAFNRGHVRVSQYLFASLKWSDADREYIRNSIESDLLSNGESTNSKIEAKSSQAQSFSEARLQEACVANDFNKVTSLLRIMPVNDGTDALLKRSIALAADNGSCESLSRLIEAFDRRWHDPIERSDALAQAIVRASRFNHALLVLQLLNQVSHSAIQRSLVTASAHGNVAIIQAILDKLPYSLDESNVREIAIAATVEGHVDCLVLLSARLPQFESTFQDVAKMGMLRAARIGDSKLANASVSLLTPGTAGGSGTAAVIVAKKHGHQDVVNALKPLQRGISQFEQPLYTLVQLNDDVLDRMLSFLDLISLAQVNCVAHRFSGRGRITEQTTRSLLADYASVRLNPEEAVDEVEIPFQLRRLAVIFTSSSHQTKAYERESRCKMRALEEIVAQAVREDWQDVEHICAELAVRAADADVAPITESLLRVVAGNGQCAVSNLAIQNIFASTVRKECLKSLGAICRIAVPAGRLSTRVLVEAVRTESQSGNSGTVFLLLATLSREALVSRRERDAMWARRRVEWERRGGVWGSAQQEEERMHGRTDQERDWDDAIAGGLRRAASYGHLVIVSSLIKMLRARGRLRDFSADAEKAFEGACRGGFDAVISELLSNFQMPEARLLEGLATAARNGEYKITRALVMEGRIPLREVRMKFSESARRGHSVALQALLQTGAIGAVTCADALEEAVRRGHEDCIPLLKQAHQALVEFEEREQQVGSVTTSEQ